MSNDERDIWRERLAGYMKRVPASINGASVQTVRGFKSWYAEATKATNNKGASEQVLRTLCNRYEGY